MKWITIEQVEIAAKKSSEAAKAMSKKHWYQIITATKQELIEGYEKGLVDIGGEYCALCERYAEKHRNCGKCPLHSFGEKAIGFSCCIEWRNAVKLWNPGFGQRWAHRKFQKAAKKLYKRICEL